MRLNGSINLAKREPHSRNAMMIEPPVPISGVSFPQPAHPAPALPPLTAFTRQLYSSCQLRPVAHAKDAARTWEGLP
jgi:hypothetical protein